MVLLHTPPGELGSLAPDFALPCVDGQTHNLNHYSAAKVLVVMFICNHCPYVQSVEGRLIALARELKPQGVVFVAISSNDVVNYPEDSFEAMKKRAKGMDYPFDYLYDESQAVAKAYGAVCTPDFFVYNSARQLCYRGRLDDSPRNPDQVKRQEMKEAILHLLADQPLKSPQHSAMGCSIKWKANS